MEYISLCHIVHLKPVRQPNWRWTKQPEEGKLLTQSIHLLKYVYKPKFIATEQQLHNIHR